MAERTILYFFFVDLFLACGEVVKRLFLDHMTDLHDYMYDSA